MPELEYHEDYQDISFESAWQNQS